MVPFYGISRVGKSTEIESISVVTSAGTELESECYLKARENHGPISIFHSGLSTSRSRKQCRHQLPISLSASGIGWFMTFSGLSTSCVMSLSDWNTSGTSSQSPHFLLLNTSSALTRCLCWAERPGQAIISKRPTSSLGVWTIATDVTVRVVTTSPTRASTSPSTFWYHHVFRLVPPNWKVLTTSYRVDLLISAYPLCSFRLSTPMQLILYITLFVILSMVSARISA